jgi:glutamyl-tRNA reductase
MSDPLAHLQHFTLATRDDFTRARSALAHTALRDAASTLRSALGPVSEVALLATCERVEFIMWADAETALLSDQATAAIGVESPPLRWRVRRGAAAARHLFSLAAGLESRIVGEREILGQVRQSLNDARASGTIGPRLERILVAALRAARSVRAQTDLGRQDLSAASIAADLFAAAAPIRHVALLGSGMVVQACVRELHTRLPESRFTAFARHLETAVERLAELPVEVAPLETLPDALAASSRPFRIDAVIAATASAAPLVTPSTLAERVGPLAMIDLGMPPNIDPRVADVPNVTLLGLTDLPVDNTPALRAVQDARQLIERQLRSFILRERHRRVPIEVFP